MTEAGLVFRTWLSVNTEGLRDFFAGMALNNFRDPHGLSADQLAAQAYQIADAMLREREKQ